MQLGEQWRTLGGQNLLEEITHIKKLVTWGDQDGRVGGCRGTHLPPRTHQNTSTCGIIFTEK